MKVIFLDVDGVLNSEQYFLNSDGTDLREYVLNNPVDPEGVRRLQQIVEESGAKIVLSSSWRGGWDKDPDKMDFDGRFLTKALAECDLEIFDKTDYIDFGRRAREIKSWIYHAPEQVESFVILDDCDYAWDKHGLGARWLRTDYIDCGLKDEHIPVALQILDRKVGLAEMFRMRLFGSLADDA